MSFNDPRIPAAFLAHSRAQVELLAACAGSPRQSFLLLGGHDVGLADFPDHDLAAIYLGLEWAAQPTGRARMSLEIAKMARTLLRSVDCWDDDDLRPFVASSCWGPGPLSALLHRVSFDEPLIRRMINALHRAANAVRALTRSHRSEARRCA